VLFYYLLSFYGKFHPRDLADLKEVLKSYDASVKAEQCVNMPRGSWLAIAAGEVKLITITVKRKTTHGADTPSLKAVAPIPEQAKVAVDQLVKAITEAVEGEREEESELEKAKARIRQLEAELKGAYKEVERLKTALAVKETLKVEVKPAEIKLPEVKLAEPPVPLPKVLESLDSDAKQVWTLLRQKPGRYKVEVMATLGWGRRRLNRALKTLQSRRLIKVQARKLYALEPII